jgi:hypothetical protein
MQWLACGGLTSEHKHLMAWVNLPTCAITGIRSSKRATFTAPQPQVEGSEAESAKAFQDGSVFGDSVKLSSFRALLRVNHRTVTGLMV